MCVLEYVGYEGGGGEEKREKFRLCEPVMWCGRGSVKTLGREGDEGKEVNGRPKKKNGELALRRPPLTRSDFRLGTGGGSGEQGEEKRGEECMCRLCWKTTVWVRH